MIWKSISRMILLLALVAVHCTFSLHDESSWNGREQRIFDHGFAIGLSMGRHSIGEIRDALQPRLYSWATIYNWIRDHRLLGNQAPTKQTGRPHCTTPRNNSHLRSRGPTKPFSHPLTWEREISPFQGYSIKDKSIGIVNKQFFQSKIF